MRGGFTLKDGDKVSVTLVRNGSRRTVEVTLGVRELLRFEAERAWQNYEEGAELLDLVDADSRGTLWLLTDSRYKAALSTLNQRRGVRATTVVEDESLPSFAKTDAPPTQP